MYVAMVTVSLLQLGMLQWYRILWNLDKLNSLETCFSLDKGRNFKRNAVVQSNVIQSVSTLYGTCMVALCLTKAICS